MLKWIFGRRFAMLELQSIPKERKALQNMINLARRQQRASRLMRLASLIIAGVALAILLLFGGAPAPAAGNSVVTAMSYTVHLPVIGR